MGLVRCNTCGLTYTAARPTDEELEAWYSAYPVAGDVSPITLLRLRELAKSFASYRRTGNLADYGAGDGHLLDAASTEGWTTYGIEYSDQQRQRLADRGHRSVGPALDHPDLPDGSCDVVVLQEVIEHLRDPAEQLTSITRLLRPGGLLYITCPNFDSLSRHMLGPSWRVIEYPEHLNYFTVPVLTRFVRRFGFEPRTEATTGLSVRDVQSAIRPTATPPPVVVSTDERIREAAAGRPAVARIVGAANAALSRLRLGDTIKAWYEKSAA